MEIVIYISVFLTDDRSCEQAWRAECNSVYGGIHADLHE